MLERHYQPRSSGGFEPDRDALVLPHAQSSARAPLDLGMALAPQIVIEPRPDVAGRTHAQSPTRFVVENLLNLTNPGKPLMRPAATSSKASFTPR